MTFVADNMAAGILVGTRWGAETSIWERDPARFGFSDPPTPHSRPENTLCASYFLLFCHHNKSATVVNAFPKSIHFEKKSWHIQEDFFFVCFFKYQTFVFFLILINTIYIFYPCIQSSQNTDTGIYKPKVRSDLSGS